MDDHIRGYIECFERLRPDTLCELEACYDEQAKFVDPFNKVRGKQAIRGVFEDMFVTCEEPRFTVTESMSEGPISYLRWQFSYGELNARQCIEGVSRIRFSPDKLVVEHMDYWDAASQLYEKLPRIGWLFRLLRKRIATPPASIEK